MKSIRIFLLILIIIGIGLLATQKIWVPKLVNQILKSETAMSPEQGSQASNTTSGWKVYTNTQHGYQISYPTDWKVDFSIKPGYNGYDHILFCPPDEISGCKENQNDTYMSDTLTPITLAQFDASSFGADTSTGAFTDPMKRYTYHLEYTDLRSETRSVPDYTSIYKQMISSFKFIK